MDDVLDKKPGSRQQNRKYGVRTGNTLRNYPGLAATAVDGFITVENDNEDNDAKNQHIAPGGYTQISINKAKRWEAVEELKKDGAVVIEEQMRPGLAHPQGHHPKGIPRDYWDKDSDDDKDEETEWTVVSTRKGRKPKPAQHVPKPRQQQPNHRHHQGEVVLRLETGVSAPKAHRQQNLHKDNWDRVPKKSAKGDKKHLVDI